MIIIQYSKSTFYAYYTRFVEILFSYSMEQFYDVIANVDDYKYFVPWCVASSTFQKSETYARADLEVGFPPISEKYSSILTLARPNLVKV